MKRGVSKIEYLIISLLIGLCVYVGFNQEPVTATLQTKNL